MSELRFRISQGVVPEPLLKKSYFATWGRVPRPTKTFLVGNELVVSTSVRGSGTVHVPWPHTQIGLSMESTESLISQDRTYSLVKELGRGSLGRLLRKQFDWQMLGFRLPQDLRIRLIAASRRFSQAVVDDEADPKVEQELVLLLEEFEQIALESTYLFTEQSLAWRTRADEKLPVLLGVGLNNHPIESLYEFDLYAKFLQEAFHAVIPMSSWRTLEPEPGRFCWEQLEKRLTSPARFGFEIVMGPLLCFDTSAFPVWLNPHLREEGFFESHAARFVNTIAERYGSTVQSWILASRFNSYAIPEISQSRAVALVRVLAQQMRSHGIETPILIGIDQPWGEYALDRIPEYDQVQIAESLMNCHEIDSFLMEINFGFNSRSTLPRDPMAVSSMIDQWSFLGKKVYVTLSVPSAIGADFSDIDQSIPPEYHWSEGLQQFWTEILLKTILGKRTVQGIFWTLLQDANENQEDTKSLEMESIPFGGLIDSQRVLKLAFKHFVSLRQSMLK
ncbi:MAG: beta-galactosidase [Planctomycetaceae bacterium]|nr:beta-galactosidase [Planctomycetaceae bacterium]